jgi:glycyl-tRNA synthetase beta subunit
MIKCLKNKISKKYITSMKFRLKKDWYIDNFFDKVKVYDEGQIFTQNEDGNYTIIGVDKVSHFMKFDDMLNAKSNDELLFEPINEEELDLVIEEISKDVDDEIKKWRIQLDVNTSLNKLKEIQKFLQENIPDLL